MHSLLVIFPQCITKLLTAGRCGVLAFAAPYSRPDPRWTNPHYSLQCRTRWTTCDTYKWLACVVCRGQSRCWAWPDGLWSTLMWSSTQAAGPSPQGPSFLFTFVIRWWKTLHHESCDDVNVPDYMDDSFWRFFQQINKREQFICHNLHLAF